MKTAFILSVFMMLSFSCNLLNNDETKSTEICGVLVPAGSNNTACSGSASLVVQRGTTVTYELQVKLLKGDSTTATIESTLNSTNLVTLNWSSMTVAVPGKVTLTVAGNPSTGPGVTYPFVLRMNAPKADEYSINATLQYQ